MGVDPERPGLTSGSRSLGGGLAVVVHVKVAIEHWGDIVLQTGVVKSDAGAGSLSNMMSESLSDPCSPAREPNRAA